VTYNDLIVTNVQYGRVSYNALYVPKRTVL